MGLLTDTALNAGENVAEEAEIEEELDGALRKQGKAIDKIIQRMKAHSGVLPMSLPEVEETFSDCKLYLRWLFALANVPGLQAAPSMVGKNARRDASPMVVVAFFVLAFARNSSANYFQSVLTEALTQLGNTSNFQLDVMNRLGLTLSSRHTRRLNKVILENYEQVVEKFFCQERFPPLHVSPPLKVRKKFIAELVFIADDYTVGWTCFSLRTQAQIPGLRDSDHGNSNAVPAPIRPPHRYPP